MASVQAAKACNAARQEIRQSPHVQGGGARVEIEGVRDMPKVESSLQLDFSSLLGPLFFEWLMQLLLPVFVFTLVHEKEHSLRVMMKMQGLPDRQDPFSSCS